MEYEFQPVIPAERMLKLIRLVRSNLPNLWPIKGELLVQVGSALGEVGSYINAGDLDFDPDKYGSAIDPVSLDAELEDLERLLSSPERFGDMQFDISTIVRILKVVLFILSNLR